MSTKLPWTPWHQVVALREDLKTGQLAQHQFAADLYEVIMQAGKRPVYEDPTHFFALTYPTANLRQLVRDVALRLAGKSDKAVQRLELWYGGGKTHTLITLRHMHADPEKLPAVASVKEFVQEIGSQPVKARVAALCCDKLDLEKGQTVRAPDGAMRTLRQPWSILAWQLAGEKGLAVLHAKGKADERDTPPAENVMTELLDLAQKDAPSILILLDEVLMYARALVDHRADHVNLLRDFFQYLTQAVAKQDRCAVVISLLSTKPEDMDQKGRQILQDLDTIIARQAEGAIEPVTKNDAAEVLRRRFFTPESLAKADAFKQHVIAALKGIEVLDKGIKDNRNAEEERFLKSYPFHPDLTEAFYGKWTQLDGFQKTRGVLRTFAMALREASQWDESPLIGPGAFLSDPAKDELSEAARELTGIASKSQTDGAANWATILQSELRLAREEQKESISLKFRELEKAVMATFLHSQPVGQSAKTRDLLLLLGDARPDKIELEKGLVRWGQISHWLDDRHMPSDLNKVAGEWRLGNRPNLTQMHGNARREITEPMLEAAMLRELQGIRAVTQGASTYSVRVHVLPDGPRDVEDDGRIHYVVLGPDAVSDSGKPGKEAIRYLTETTSADRPRQHVNSILVLAPSGDGMGAAKNRIRDSLAWDRVRDDLKQEESKGGVDAGRMQTLDLKLSQSRRDVPATIRQAWCICVTISEQGTPEAFKLTITDEPTFLTMKANKRARLQDSAISADALLPGGPYNFWQEGETFRRVKDLAGAFSQFPHLPKMLKAQAILDTLAEGCESGVFVLRQVRPDRSIRTFWRVRPDAATMDDPGLELVLPAFAELTDLDSAMLAPGKLADLWSGATIEFKQLLAYFQGNKVVQVDRGGWKEPVSIPKAKLEAIENAVRQAVERGSLWLTSGPASLWQEPVPPGVLQESSVLRIPHAAPKPADLLPANLPAAWREGTTTAMGLHAAISQAQGLPLPWKMVQDAIQSALISGFLELVPGSAAWPCAGSGAGQVSLREPTRNMASPYPSGALKPAMVREESRLPSVEMTLSAEALQAVADRIPSVLALAMAKKVEVSFLMRVELQGPGDTLELRKEIERMLKG